jgi:polynucleotide 5'-hydroxyl-kinase GRC3/NOL9
MQTTLIIGAADTGKTTLTARWARWSAAEGASFVLDADTGQSEIGPPGCVGLARAQSDIERLGDLKPEASFFVGALTPSSAALEHAVAVRRGADLARSLGADRLFVDTPGWVAGPGARRWLSSLAQLLAPDTVAVVDSGKTLEGLSRALASVSGARIEIVAQPEGVQRKPAGLRATRRVTRLSKALANSRPLALPLDRLATVGTTLGTGEPLPPELLRWCTSALKMPVGYAEQSEGTLAVFIQGHLRPGWESLVGPVAYHFKVKVVRPISLAALDGVLLGLHDDAGRLLSMGRFTGLDPERGELLCSAPLSESATDRVALAAFGRVCCAPDGSAIQELRPGEL